MVVHEILRGARTREEESFARRREHYDAKKVRELVFDVLIALTARSIGATRRHLRFEAVYW